MWYYLNCLRWWLSCQDWSLEKRKGFLLSLSSVSYNSSEWFWHVFYKPPCSFLVNGKEVDRTVTAGYLVKRPGDELGPWNVCKIQECAGCLENVQQDAIQKSGDLGCHDIGTCGLSAKGAGTETIWEMHRKARHGYFCGIADCTCQF